MKRRKFIQNVGVGSALSLMPFSWASAHLQDWQKVQPADLTKLTPDAFLDHELDLPYYLAHFHVLANGVKKEGKNKGFIDVPIWRNERDNKPYNARIMENILSMVFFYTTNRSWNPYYKSQNLKKIIEASIYFVCSIQNEDGRFSEYGPQKWNLAATGFFTHFMGETLGLLHQGPNIDIEVFNKALATDRKAIYALLTMDVLMEHGKSYSNQFTNAWPGALLYLDIYPDPEIEALFKKVFRETMDVFQSPVGFFYENDGPDWSYNLGVHESNLMTAWHYLKNTELAPLVVKKVDRFYDWFSYNAVMEPWKGSELFFMNRAIETRTERAVHRPEKALTGTVPVAKPVPLARPFLVPREDLQYHYDVKRKALESKWPYMDPIYEGQFFSYSPHTFQHRREDKWYPDREQREQAIQELPYLKYNAFIHQRMDDKTPAIHTFIKRPGYYIAFNSGQKVDERQRYGIGLGWHPKGGTFLQSQTETNQAAWGTLGDRLYEAEDLEASFLIGGEGVTPKVGLQNFTNNPLTIQYPLGEQGSKEIAFDQFGFSVNVEHPGNFREYLPLVIRDQDEIDRENDKIVLMRNGFPIEIIHPVGMDIASHTRELPNIEDYHVTVFVLSAVDQLRYEFRFPK